MDRVPRAWMKPLDDDYKVKPLPERKRRPWRETALGRAVMVPIDRLDPYVRWSELVERMVFGLMLNTDVFKDAHEDDSANLQALAVILIVAVVQNISLLLIGMFWFGFFGAFAYVGRAISDAMISWVIWLLVAYVLCKVLFRSRAGIMQLFRTLAFAYVPAIFLIFQIIPLYGVTLAALTYLALDRIRRLGIASGAEWIDLESAPCQFRRLDRPARSKSYSQRRPAFHAYSRVDCGTVGVS